MSNGPLTAFLMVGVVLAALASFLTQDDLFRAHSLVMAVVLFLSMLVVIGFADYRPAHMRASRDGDSLYMDDVVRVGTIATLFWGIVGFLVGVVIAAQLAWPDLNFEPYFNFNRLRPLHTSAVIFAFGGNALLATSFYVVQRTCRARLFGGGSYSGATSYLSSWLPPATCSERLSPKNMQSRNGMWTCG